MAGGDLNTSSGGIHPGKPILWPTGKSTSSSEPVTQANTTQTAGNVRSSASAKSSAAQAAETLTTPQTAQAPARTAVNIARALTISDIKQHLLQLQIPDTDFNVKLASMMIKDGLEISRTNVIKLLTMLQGSNKSGSTQEAAIMLLMKGIDSPEALTVLSSFFSENPQIAAQLTSMQEGINNLIAALSLSKGVLDSNLVSQLGALLSQFDDTMAKMDGKSQIKGNNLKLASDVRALKALLSGVQEKASSSNSAEAKALQSNLQSASAKLNSVMDNLVAQALLSQKGRDEVNFLYQQVPNVGIKPPKDLEIVVKREGGGPDTDIDPENTQVVMSLQTANLGKMVCSIFVKGKRVYVIFVFNEKQHGDAARDAISKEFGNLQKKLVENNFIVSGYQVKVDPAMCAVKPYLIPMLASLGDQLKKIDLEA